MFSQWNHQKYPPFLPFITRLYGNKPAAPCAFNKKQTKCMWDKGAVPVSFKVNTTAYIHPFLSPGCCYKSSMFLMLDVYQPSLCVQDKTVWHPVILYAFFFSFSTAAAHRFAFLHVHIPVHLFVTACLWMLENTLRWCENLVVITIRVPGNDTGFTPPVPVGLSLYLAQPLLRAFVKPLVETQNHQICVGHIVRH